jgi:hypothetical protein
MAVAERTLGETRAPPEQSRPPPRRTELWRAARADWIGAARGDRAILLGATGMLAYEWSAGNETLCTLLITTLLRHQGSAPGVLLAGVVAGLLVFAQQVLSGLILLKAVGKLKHLIAVLVAVVDDRFAGGTPRYRSLGVVTRIAISFVMGASFVAVEDTLAGEPRPRRSILVSAATTGLTIVVITGLIGGAVVAAAGTVAAGPVGVIYAVAADWRFWLALLVLPPLLRGLVRRLRTVRRRRPADLARRGAPALRSTRPPPPSST